jgi:hypothetical protein
VFLLLLYGESVLLRPPRMLTYRAAMAAADGDPTPTSSAKDAPTVRTKAAESAGYVVVPVLR